MGQCSFAILNRRRFVGALAALAAAGAAGCTDVHTVVSAPASAPVTPRPVTITGSPLHGAVEVNPLAVVQVTASGGTLESVVMVNDASRPVDGIITPDGLQWTSAEPLGYGRTYTVTVTSRDVGGARSTQSRTFTTVQPANQTMVYLTTTGGDAFTEGGRYGVGTVVVARFDEAIGDRLAAERHLSVTTNPPVTGAWHWLDDQNAHWRPAQYYQPGTRVTVEATIYGVAVGEGLYGQQDSRVSFLIGDAHISIADDTTKQVSVYDNGRLVRTMPTSMGMGGTERIAGSTISFWTQPGVYTVMGTANPVVMDSSSYGLPINSRLGYKESINYATRISTDGVYLHQLDATTWVQGNTNVSHGCLNLNADNARWFYDFSVPGDVVEVINTGGDPLQMWQNGDWSVPWERWVSGSALQ